MGLSMSSLDAVLSHIDRDIDTALERLFAFLRIPSISTDPAYAGEVKKAAAWLEADIASLGFKAETLPTPGHPVVMGHVAVKKAPHVLFYGHYDVQPVDPLNLWSSPPFEPQMIELEPGRKAIRARGASDDKGQVMTFLEACRAFKAVRGTLPLGITLLIEGEEENGSVNLPAFIKSNKAKLKADVALICDTSMWDRKTPAITTSLRGMVYEEVTITAANRDLHSGLYGGPAMNPIRVLTTILADLHDKEGRVALPGFYKGVKDLPKDILADWKRLKLTAKDFLGEIGLSQPAGEKGRLVIEQIAARPTCDVNGIWGGYTGEGSKTVIPSTAHAKISFRLVGDQDPLAIRKAFRAFVEKRLPKDCTVSFIGHKGSRAVQLPWTMPLLARTREALSEEWGKKTVLIGSGGSIPVVGDFKETLGLDSLLVGFALGDDCLHSPNEKYDLVSFHKGIRSWVRIIDRLAKAN
jgi:acetylornithine deacetylase/succinyl-diaminopimelate desuccinylase-like protein